MSNRERMIFAMRIMGMVCNASSIECVDCPFEKMCACLNDNSYPTPPYWEKILDNSSKT